MNNDMKCLILKKLMINNLIDCYSRCEITFKYKKCIIFSNYM